MEQLKKSLIFWLLLIVSVVVPSVANAQTTSTKKILWQSQITADGRGVGVAQITRTMKSTWNAVLNRWVVTSDKFEYAVQSYVCASSNDPCTEAYATEASLAGPGITVPWVRILCDEGTCGYSAEGDLTTQGDVDPAFTSQQGANLPMVIGQEGTMEVRLNGGAAGSGKFKRIL
jgi:hypothetical protein